MVHFVRLEEDSADILNKNCPEKLHTKHAARIRNGNLECWSEDVEDKQILLADSNITSTSMTSQPAQPTVMVRNSMEQEGQFRKIYAGFVNGIIAIPTEQVQHARLNDKTETIEIANHLKSTNEKEWIEVKNKSKKVRFVKQDQFGKTK